MATVVDKSGNSRNDRKLCVANRSNAGAPSGTLTPLYPGEIVVDTTNRVLWRGIGTANTSWQPITELVH